MKKKLVGITVLLAGLILCGAWALAAGGYTKDSGVVVSLTFVEDGGAGTLNESLSNQLESLYGAGTYTGDRVYNNGSEQIISVYRNGDKMGWHLVDADGVIEVFVLEDHEYIFVRKSATEKITAQLMDAMEQSSDELIPVYVWLEDIDTEEVISAIPETLSVNGRSVVNESDQAYIMQKRESLSEAYTTYNNSFLNSFFENVKEEQISTSLMFEEAAIDQTAGTSAFSFASAYAPMCLLELSSAQILEVVEDERVSEIGLIPDCEIVSCATSGGASVQGSYVRDTNGHTGEGAIVGIIEEYGFPDASLAELRGADITLRNVEGEEVVTSDHATRVAAIICGQTIGLAPDCKVYATYTRDKNSAAETHAEFIDQMEWLLAQGVHVINVSMSVPIISEEGESGIYNDIDRWVDHVDMNHDVLVVSAVGNNETGFFADVMSPALSYNGIAVGAYDDNDDTNHSNDVLADFSCYEELDNQEYENRYLEYYERFEEKFIIAPEKPDLIAPGVNIDIPGMPVDETNDKEEGLNDGTSFAAPFVTATVAQMIDAKPELKTQPAIIKAALIASAFRKIDPNDYWTAGSSRAFSDKEGAGKLDSKNAIYVIASTNYTYEYFWSSTKSHTFTISANASETQMRVALTWLKQSVLNADELPTGVEHSDEESISLVNDRPLSDWDLEVYDPNGNLVSGGYSYMRDGNVEVVEFDPQITGTYTIKIIKRGGSTEKEFVYLAWW